MLLAAAMAGLAVWAVLVYVNLQVPWLGLKLLPSENAVRVEAVAEHHPNSARIAPGDVLLTIGPQTAEPIQLQADDLLKEPDVLIDKGAYSGFMARQQRIYSAYSGGRMNVVLSDGQRIELLAEARPLGAISWLFWLECAWTLTCLLLGAAIWAFRRDEASAYLLGTGIAYFVFVAGDAMYGTRELALPSDLFYLFSFANSAGAMFYPASLVALLWNYPCRVGGRWLPPVIFVLAIMALLGSRLQLPGTGLYLLPAFILLCCVIGLGLAVMQWRRSRPDPVAHAIARWIIAILFLSVWLSAVLMTVPVLLGMRQLAPQSLLFGVFLIFYLGLAVGVGRYRVFDLDRWWFRAWGWFLGGLVVLLLDALLLSLFHMGKLLSLSLSLAVVGWLYFPVRQWLWTGFFQRTQSPLEQALPQVIDVLFAVDSERAIRERWPELLQKTFSALNVESGRQGLMRIERSNDGTRLCMPALEADGDVFEVVYPAGGSRLFTGEDIQLAEVLLALMRRAVQAVRAREQGADTERARIRRDLHDDLGAQLVDMTQRLPDKSSRDQAREAVSRLRAVLTAMGEDSTSLSDALGEWQAEADARLSEAGISCEWRADIQEDLRLTARQRANLVHILREAITNIIRHSGAAKSTFSFSGGRGALEVVIADDGHGRNPESGAGLGLAGMQQRMEELGGSLRLGQSVRGGLQLDIRLPL